MAALDLLLAGEMDKAMMKLHAKPPRPKPPKPPKPPTPDATPEPEDKEP
jgi:PTH1 family peptidyl-tRNA hydrolase